MQKRERALFLPVINAQKELPKNEADILRADRFKRRGRPNAQIGGIPGISLMLLGGTLFILAIRLLSEARCGRIHLQETQSAEYEGR
jgi:hypothetical protein